MPCTGGRELKQKLANAVIELATARKMLTDESVSPSYRTKRLRDAEANHEWADGMLYKHLDYCFACHARESAIRPITRLPGADPRQFAR